MPSPGFRVGARRAVSPRAIHVIVLESSAQNNYESRDSRSQAKDSPRPCHVRLTLRVIRGPGGFTRGLDVEPFVMFFFPQLRLLFLLLLLLLG